MSYRKEVRRVKKRTRNCSRKKLRRIAEIDRILAGESKKISTDGSEYKPDAVWFGGS